MEKPLTIMSSDTLSHIFQNEYEIDVDLAGPSAKAVDLPS